MTTDSRPYLLSEVEASGAFKERLAAENITAKDDNRYWELLAEGIAARKSNYLERTGYDLGSRVAQKLVAQRFEQIEGELERMNVPLSAGDESKLREALNDSLGDALMAKEGFNMFGASSDLLMKFYEAHVSRATKGMNRRQVQAMAQFASDAVLKNGPAMEKLAGEFDWAARQQIKEEKRLARGSAPER